MFEIIPQLGAASLLGRNPTVNEREIRHTLPLTHRGSFLKQTCNMTKLSLLSAYELFWTKYNRFVIKIEWLTNYACTDSYTIQDNMEDIKCEFHV